MKLPFSIRSSSRAVIMASALSLSSVLPLGAHALPVKPSPEAALGGGVLVGDSLMVGERTLDVFRGIPYAAPPTGSYRWREPQPVGSWSGKREAKRFAPRCMQMKAPGMAFRSQTMSEDCLYLNVWAPRERIGDDKLPVLVYFHGGGFAFGDGSEPRYDGAQLAARGTIVVTVNYRLGAFGFMMHPDASRENATGAAGNFGLLDQQAALRWVRDNIERFGGDAGQVTIGGETTGATAVSAHMAAPSSRGLFARAIGESGGAFTPNVFWRREKAERVARSLAARLDAPSLEAMRSMSAEKVQEAMGTYRHPEPFFWPSIDGHFLIEAPAAVFEAGGQAPVPLLVGSNSQESHFRTVYGTLEPTPENWTLILGTVFGKDLAQARTFYPGNDAQQITQSASTLANDLTLAHSAWRWMDLHRQTGRAPVYFYLFSHRRPPAVSATADAADSKQTPPETGAPHRSEIVYVLDNLDQDRRYRWTDEDRAVSRIFSGYVEQFVKTGNPNGAPGAQTGSPMPTAVPAQGTPPLPNWPAVRQERDGLARQAIDTDTRTIERRASDAHRARHERAARKLSGRPRLYPRRHSV